MKGLIMNDLFSLRKLLRSVAMVFVFFMVLWGAMGQPPEKAVKMATTVVATVPILIIYPFVQKYFTKGVMVGAVKG